MASINTANNIYGALSAKNKGIGGLATGLDTESLVEALTLATRSKIAKQQQKKTSLQWKQTAYRSTASTLRTFQQKYFTFQTANASKDNMLNSNYWNMFSGTSSDSSVKVTTSSGSSGGKITVENVTSLATQKQITTNSKIESKIKGGDVSFSPTTDFTGKTITVQTESSSRTIALDTLNGKGTEAAVQAELNSLLEAAFGFKSDGVTALVQSNITAGSAVGTFNVELESDIKITAASGSALNINANSSNRVTSNTKLEAIFPGLDGIGANGDDLTIEINGKQISLKKTDTVGTLTSKINNSLANVKLVFDSVTQKISMTSNEFGAGDTLNVKDVTGNLMNNIFGTAGGASLGSATSPTMIYKYDDTQLEADTFAGLITTDALMGYLSSGTGKAAIRVTIDGVTKDIVFNVSATDIATKKTTEETRILAKYGAANIAALTPAQKAELDEAQDSVLKSYLGTQVTKEMHAQFGIEAQAVFYIDNDGKMGFKQSAGSDSLISISQSFSANNFYTALGYANASVDNYNPATATTLGDLGMTAGDLNISLNGAPSTTFSYTAGTTLRDFVDQVNGTPGFAGALKVENGRLFINEKNVESLDISDSAGGNFLNHLFNVSTYTSAGAVPGTSTVTGGDNASLDINGVPVTSNSNKFTVNGTTFEITTPNTPDFTINVTADSTDLVDRIQSFVDEYNTMTEAINKMVYEEKVAGYDPLTEEQRADMTDEQIKKWETEAKKGLLRSDPALRDLLSNLRSTIYEKVEASGLSPYDIGLTVGSMNDRAKGSNSFDLGKSGLLHLDKEKLSKALEQNGDAVRMMFTNDDTTLDADGKMSNLGLARKLNTAIDRAANTTSDVKNRGTLVSIAGYEINSPNNTFDIGRKVETIDKAISALKMRLETEYKRHWRKFSALETAISKMSAQSSWLTENAS